MKLTTHIFLFGLIVLIAAVFRLYALGEVPSSPDWDEASLGYNAYSILRTGRDEYGEFLPYVLRSFGDYKPAFYTYLAIPSIALFGLSTFAVRLPSVVMGLIALIATYFLVKELFEKDNFAINTKRITLSFPLLVMFFLAISPWHIQFSRIAFEANAGLTFVILGLLFFLTSLRRKSVWLLLFSFLSFVISIYTYQSEKVFVPLLLIVLIILYWKQLLMLNKKLLIGSLIISLLLLLPMVHFTIFNKNGLARAQASSFLSAPTPVMTDKYLRRIEVDTRSNDYIGLVMDNRRVIYAKRVVENYLSHFNPNFLFITGDANGRHHAPQMGHLYLFELPLLFLGFYVLIFSKISKKAKILLVSWLLITPIPAALTWDVPNAVRTLSMIPILSVLIALGFINLVKVIQNRNLFVMVISYLLVVSCMLANISYYINQYFVQYNYFSAQDFQYGYREAIEEVKKMENKYDTVLVSDVRPLDQSYIFFLYYLAYDPATYQKETMGKNTRNFSKYEFRPIHWKQDSKPHTLLLGTSKDFPKGVAADQIIYNPDGTEAIRIIRRN